MASLERHGQLRSAVLAEVELVTACAAVGADDRAVLAAKRAIERAESTNLMSYAERARAHFALPLARRGDLAGAEGVARAARDAAVAASDRVTEARARAGLAAVRCLGGDWEGAELEAREVLSNEAFPEGVRADVSAILDRAPRAYRSSRLAGRFRAASPDARLAPIGLPTSGSQLFHRAACAPTRAAAAAGPPSNRCRSILRAERAPLISSAVPLRRYGWPRIDLKRARTTEADPARAADDLLAQLGSTTPKLVTMFASYGRDQREL